MGLMIRKARRRRKRKYEFDDAADLLVFHIRQHALFVYARIMIQRGSCVGVSHAVGHVMLVKISGCKSQWPQGRVLAAVAHYRFCPRQVDKRKFACRARTSLTTNGTARCLGSRNMQSTSDKKARANSTA